MPGFKLQIVVVGVRAETKLFNCNSVLFFLGFFFFPFLFVKVFAVVNDLTNRWTGIRCDFNQIEIERFCQLQSACGCGYFMTVVGFDYPNLWCVNFIIQSRPVFFDWRPSKITFCDSFPRSLVNLQVVFCH